MQHSSPVVGPAAPDADDEIDLSQIFGTLWRGRMAIVLCALLALGVGWYYVTTVAIPLYPATTTIELETEGSAVIDLESIVSGVSSDRSALNTEIEILRSRALLEEIVGRLDLASDPEFNPDLTVPRVNTPEYFVDRFLPMDAAAAPRSEAQVLSEAVDILREKLSISNPRDTYVFNITATTWDAGKSTDIANALADEYIRNQLAKKNEQAELALRFLTERASELQVELQETELEAKNFAASTELVSPESLAAKNRQVKELRDRVQGLEEALERQERDLSVIERLRAGEGAGIDPEVIGDRGLATLVRNRGAGNLDDRALAQVASSIRSQRDRNAQQIASLSQTIEELERQIQTQSSDLLTLQQLEREAEVNRTLYEYFLTRLREASVQQGIQTADARILSAAVPRPATSPRAALIYALSLIVGGMVGAALVLFRELRRTGLRTPEDLESLTGTTVLGQIPVAKIRRRKALIDYIEKKPNSAFSETVRNLRTSVLLSNVDTPPRIIMLTSSIPGEGKTTLSLSLAKNLSGLGKKTLLIEADIRRRTFDQYFDTRNKPKLVDAVLSDEAILDFATQEPKLGVHLLFGGRSGINAADFFASDKFKSFMTRAREEFDYVVIDTPPVLAVPDARIIGQHADAVIYAVHWDRTPRAQVQAGLRSFRDVKLTVAGTVLTQIDPKGMKRYGYGGSYAAYSSKYYEN